VAQSELHLLAISAINASIMTSDFALLARKPLQALRSGRFWLSPLLARLSPQSATVMRTYRLQEEGRFAEALAAWKTLDLSDKPQLIRYLMGLRRARLALQAKRWNEAIEEFEKLAVQHPTDQRISKGLESAALRGARDAQSKGDWLEACKMWVVFGRASSDTDKCLKNLRDCARYVAQSADNAEMMADAVQAWQLLKTVDPFSREAQMGIEWALLSLARMAERESDMEKARVHWHALLEVSPGDQRALDGLARLDLAGTVGA
jgi:tetratricopeptide (TPR) repeat protein